VATNFFPGWNCQKNSKYQLQSYLSHRFIDSRINSKTKTEDSENRFYVKGSYVAELTRSPVDSDAESSEDEDEDAGSWFWSTKSKQATNCDSKPEGCSESDSELMTSSSNDEDDVKEDEGSWKWCSIL